MITFEKQKVIKPTERNSGASEYTLYRGDSTDTKPIVAQPGDVFEEYDTGKSYVCSRDAKGRTVWTEDANAKRQTPSAGGGGSAYTLPTASASTKGGVKIGSGLTMTGEVLSVTGGGSSGGAEKFVVTLTQDNDTWTADKTIVEIAEAYDGNVVVASVPTEAGISAEIPCTFATNDTMTGCLFSGVVGLELSSVGVINVMGISQNDSDEWGVSFLDDQTVPPHSAFNNGQVLGVSSGSLDWVDHYNPLFVSLTQDKTNTNQYEGNKTFKQIYDAYITGQKVMFSYSGSYGDVFYANYDGVAYEITAHFDGDNVTGEGGANDLFSFTTK